MTGTQEGLDDLIMSTLKVTEIFNISLARESKKTQETRHVVVVKSFKGT